MTTLNITTNKINNSLVNVFNPQKQDQTHLPWLIYLPGMDGTGKLFSNQIPKLAPHFNLRCLSIPSQDLSNWEQLTSATIDCLKQELSLCNTKQVYLCGESFGGCLAMSVAVTIPQLFAGMILVNPASSFNQQPILSWGIEITRWMPQWIHSNSALSLLPFLAELNRLKKSDRRALLEAMKSLPQEIVSWRLSLLRDFSIEPYQGKKFEQPTLVIAGNRDRLLPSVEEASKLVNIFSNSVMEILPNSGHACLLEAETNLASILAKHQFFLKI